MGYIMDLRKKVGHDNIVGVGSTVLVFNKNNEVLLNLRSDTNNWGLPGGSAELFETIEDSARRELYEEDGIKLNKLELITVLSGKEYYFVYPNGDEMCSVIVLYKCTDYTGDIKVNDTESFAVKFFDMNNLPEMESRTKIIFDKIKSGEIKI